jgi:hypothetical protein
MKRFWRWAERLLLVAPIAVLLLIGVAPAKSHPQGSLARQERDAEDGGQPRFLRQAATRSGK